MVSNKNEDIYFPNISDTDFFTPTFVTVKNLTPKSRNVNIILKIVRFHFSCTSGHSIEDVDAKRIRILEVIAGDDTGTILLLLKDEQINVCQKSDTIVVRNALVTMFNKRMRLQINGEGTIEPAQQEALFTVCFNNDVSSVDFEVIRLRQQPYALGSYQRKNVQSMITCTPIKCISNSSTETSPT